MILFSKLKKILLNLERVYVNTLCFLIIPLIISVTSKLKVDFGISKTAVTKIAKLWKSFMATLKLDKKTWESVLVWTNRKSTVRIDSTHNTYLLLMEMCDVLSETSIRIKWLQYLKSQSCAIVKTSTGWEVQTSINIDSSEFCSWLLGFNFGAKGNFII